MSQAAAINPRAALLRDEAGAIVGATEGNAQCWSPRRPSEFVSFNQLGGETIVRCRECKGCLEYERRYLARRIDEHYREEARELWIVTVESPIEGHASLAARLTRSESSNFESGFYRCGAGKFALIAIGGRPRITARGLLSKCSWTCSKVLRSRGRRAWSGLTSGMLLSRNCVGEWRNRWYHRGLKPLPKEFTWTRASRYTRGIAKRHGARELSGQVRAWSGDSGVYLPDAVRIAMLKGKRPEVRIRDPEIIASIGKMVTALASRLPVIAAPRSGAAPVLSGFRNTRALHGEGLSDDEGQAMRSAASPSLPQHADLNSVKGSGYSGSPHSIPREIAESIARMAELARSRRDRGGG